MPAADWDALVDANDPFVEHAFLAALERSGTVGDAAGWRPHFVLARQSGRLLGAVPLYLKDNSYGEFIFDWAWANAAHRNGLRYFPKLVAAVPFTPATGSRLLVLPGADRPAIIAALVDGMRKVAADTDASSIHLLFCTDDESTLLVEQGFDRRLSLQFHWNNRRPDPYRDFEDYLSAFRSRNRKQVRKERAVAAAHGLRFATLTGPELSDADWRALEGFYHANAGKHDATTYLTPQFFAQARKTLAHRVVATLAYRADSPAPVAGALNFERGTHLYGRYWGCTEEREMLHFELCYYRLIDRAICRGYTHFEAGAQGEHKLKRGLLPSLTYSAHWLRHADFGRAVRGFIAAEAEAVKQQVAEYQALSPFALADSREANR